MRGYIGGYHSRQFRHHLLEELRTDYLPKTSAVSPWLEYFTFSASRSRLHPRPRLNLDMYISRRVFPNFILMVPSFYSTYIRASSPPRTVWLQLSFRARYSS